MMDKDNESITTVEMKPEYAPSEVYSTSSEPPPAYKNRNSNSVKIARIVAFTVIISSTIIGCCILGSSYLQARASCNYMDTIQAALEKELLLEKMEDYPQAEALHDSESKNILNSIDNFNDQKDSSKMLADKVNTKTNTKDTNTVSENDLPDNEDDEGVKLPLELELDAIEKAILSHTQQTKLNCVVERRRAENIADAPIKSIQLPFGLNIRANEQQNKITGERLVIMCETGREEKSPEDNEVEIIRQIVVPLNEMTPLQFGPRGPQFPLTHLPNQMDSAIQQRLLQQQRESEMHHSFIPPPFISKFIQQLQQQRESQPQFHDQPQAQIQGIPVHKIQQQQQQQHQQLPQMPAQMMQAPRPESEIRIQLQRVEIPMRDMRPDMEKEGQDTPQVQVQQIPLSVALQRAGITADDLKNIQQMAEERIKQEMKQFVSEHGEYGSEDSSEEVRNVQIPQHPLAQVLLMGRSAYGRSLVTPIRIPVPMMQQIEETQSDEAQQSDRPHYVHPRSIRNVEASEAISSE